MPLNLDPQQRAKFLCGLKSPLLTVVPRSVVELHGSIATGSADEYSDIDLVWEIPDDQFDATVLCVEETLTAIQSVSAMQFDPLFQASDRRRRIFVHYCNLPLFWQVKLDIMAKSIQKNFDYDTENIYGRPRNRTLPNTYISLMDCIAAIKGLLRQDELLAAHLVSGAFQRIALPVTGVTTHERLLRLVNDIYDADDSMANVAAQVKSLHSRAFVSGDAEING